MTIKASEGHGRNDGKIEGNKISNYNECRFSYPKFPLNRTVFIQGLHKDLSEEEVKQRKADLKKIKKFLIRQTYKENNEETEQLKSFNKLTFFQFLVEVGMFDCDKKRFTEDEKKMAYQRYINALSASVRGTGAVFLKRATKDVFTNNFNRRLLEVHKANHDLQIVVDQVCVLTLFHSLLLLLLLFQYACAQYVIGYLTKSEAGMSQLLRAVNEQAGDMTNMEILNQLASVLDKHREVSIQETVYRVLSLPMTKSSVIVKYLSTMHPHFRDGLLKSDLENIDDDESIFHNSPHTYYEKRELECLEGIDYQEDECQPNYWHRLTLADFRSDYDIVYNPKSTNRKHIPLKDGVGYIKRRIERCILRYYLNFDNEEDLKRGLLILFTPFVNEMEDIHENDINELYTKFENVIKEKRAIFEKHKVMTEIIESIQKEATEKIDENNDSESDTFLDEETTSKSELENFEKWAKDQAK